MASISLHQSVLSNLDKTKRINQASMWTVMDENSSGTVTDDMSTSLHTKNRDYKQQSIQEWLNTSCILHPNEQQSQSPQRTGIMSRMNSAEDDLMLGVEANLYPSGIQNMQEYMRSLHTCSEKHTLSRWNSITSAISVTSGAKSVIELLNIWKDDPEELLLDLGFGKEEADISMKVPARFFNTSSVACGINLGVFLDAQKLRIQMENPDLYGRFRQLEVLQQVNNAFSSLLMKTNNENPSSELITEEKQKLDTKRKCRKLLRKMSQSMNHSPGFTGSDEKSLSLDRQATFQCAHQSIPEDSVLAPLTVRQNEAENQTSDLPLKVKEGQDNPLEEMTTKDQDRRARLTMYQTKKWKLCTAAQPPDSFEMEEVQSFEEDSSSKMAVSKIYLDVKRENSCQSDSSGFLEDPFIPLQIHHTQRDVSKDSMSSQDTCQENRQWLSQCSNAEQATGDFPGQICVPGSVDSDQTQCAGACIMSRVLQEEKILTVENLNSHSPTSSDQQSMESPCAVKNPGEINGLSGGSSCLHTTTLENTNHSSVFNTNTWLSNEIQVQNNAGGSQDDNSKKNNATSVSNLNTNRESTNIVSEHFAATSKLVTFQIPQGNLQARNITEFHSLEPLSFQPNEDTSQCDSTHRENRVKFRDAVVQTDENTGEYTTEKSQRGQVKNLNLLAMEFQFGRLLTKSMSLDTGLHNVETIAQEPISKSPAHCHHCPHCHHCHHCCCLHHHCSSTCFSRKDTNCQSKTPLSYSETQLIKTLQQLQQATQIISSSPNAIWEIETMRKSLQGFRNRLVELEQDIIEQQASVYNILTDNEREDVKRLQALRRAVRQEITEMEIQLGDWARQLGDGMRMQLQSLVEEQSAFCSYAEVLRQTGSTTSETWPLSSSSSAIPTPPTSSQEPDCNAGIILPVHLVSALNPTDSVSTKTDIEPNLEADKDADLKVEKQTLQSEMMDFRSILKSIKQSFNHLRLPSPETTISNKHSRTST
ncbi:protein ITPRID1 isoform X1 [Chiloscyllium plagiosum]|uniref:protein ITPRID1 isoform X1 n=2 Tax=Chiloscyllium plagiosum TaxID=36176 RepID=UPI001CB80C54|nr:protein ITPRID1 isoform X1 [Chiloscyllium plagiosum]XP_043544753.1 protein ITPRID1 isoform X1 [Chiloscyllium plagiosum]